jgi:hypothetical protein
MAKPTRPKVSAIEYAILVLLVVVNIGLVSFAAFKVSSDWGHEAGRELAFTLPTLILGGLYSLCGISSLKETLRSSSADNDSDGVTIEALRVSPTYTAQMLIHGVLLLLVTITSVIAVILLNFIK